MIKLNFSAITPVFSVHDPSEVILIYWFGAQDTFDHQWLSMLKTIFSCQKFLGKQRYIFLKISQKKSLYLKQK